MLVLLDTCSLALTKYRECDIICLLMQKKRRMITSLGETARWRNTVTTNRSFIWVSLVCPLIFAGNYWERISARPAHHATSYCADHPARSHHISCVETKSSDLSCQHPDRDNEKAGERSRHPTGHRIRRTFRKFQVPRTSNGRYYLPMCACLLDAFLLKLFQKPITPVTDALTTATPVAV